MSVQGNSEPGDERPVVAEAQAVMGQNRRLLPRIDYDSILANNGAPNTSDVLAGFAIPRDRADVYRAPPGMSAREWLYCVTRSFATSGTSTSERLTWMYTALEAAIPGFGRYVAGTDVDLTFVDPSEEYGVMIRAGTVSRQRDDVSERSVAGADGNDEEPEELTQEHLDLTTFTAIRFAPWRDGEPVVMPPADDTSAGLAMLGLLFFAIAKTPNGVNDAGFRMKRPKGMAGTIGRDNLPDEWVPTMDQYRSASSTFQMLPGPRERLVRELCIWGKSSKRSWAQGILVSQTRLWRGHGLTGLDMVRELLVNFGSVIETLPELASSVLGFNEHEARYRRAVGDPLRDYQNIILADRSPLRGNGRYTLLVMIAKDFQARNAASMQQFGTSINAVYEDRIRQFALQVGLSVPQYAT